jgi:hypothetical protein
MADEKKLPIITVKGAGDDGKVVLWERDEQHPPHIDKDGNETKRPHEAFVSNDGMPRKVAETAEVRRLLAEELLVKVSEAPRVALAEPKK